MECGAATPGDVDQLVPGDGGRNAGYRTLVGRRFRSRGNPTAPTSDAATRLLPPREAGVETPFRDTPSISIAPPHAVLRAEGGREAVA